MNKCRHKLLRIPPFAINAKDGAPGVLLRVQRSQSVTNEKLIWTGLRAYTEEYGEVVYIQLKAD
jgi:hypothetical protein